MFSLSCGRITSQPEYLARRSKRLVEVPFPYLRSLASKLIGRQVSTARDINNVRPFVRFAKDILMRVCIAYTYYQLIYKLYQAVFVPTNWTMLAQPEYCVFAIAFMPGIKPSFILRACIAGLRWTGFAVACASKEACRNVIASWSSTIGGKFNPLVVCAIAGRQLCLGVVEMYRRESLYA